MGLQLMSKTRFHARNSRYRKRWRGTCKASGMTKIKNTRSKHKNLDGDDPTI